MLEPLFDLIEKVKKLDEKLIFIQVIYQEEIRDFIVGLNRYNQLYNEGENVDGNVVGYYTKFTEEITGGRKKEGERYNFYDTGDFYKSFRVQVYSDGEFTIEANTIKEDGDIAVKFEKQSGAPILGLTDESMAKLKEKILPEIISETLKQLT